MRGVLSESAAPESLGVGPGGRPSASCDSFPRSAALHQRAEGLHPLGGSPGHRATCLKGGHVIEVNGHGACVSSVSSERASISGIFSSPSMRPAVGLGVGSVGRIGRGKRGLRGVRTVVCVSVPFVKSVTRSGVLGHRVLVLGQCISIMALWRKRIGNAIAMEETPVCCQQLVCVYIYRYIIDRSLYMFWKKCGIC